jgi:hypothetical protein
MGNVSTRILGRQMAQQALSDTEINFVSGGGPYTGRGLSPDSMSDVGPSPGYNGTIAADD